MDPHIVQNTFLIGFPLGEPGMRVTMTEIEMTSEITVKLVRAMASDDMVVQAAQVSAKGENNPETVPARLINALMRDGHGSPFEHNAFTFFAEAPIFVFREWHRHRIASINEMSGRYTKLLPKFYRPDADRKMVNIGTPMQPEFAQGDEIDHEFVQQMMYDVDALAWRNYEKLLEDGIANEVARMVLPVNVYSQMYWTVNARSLMNFLKLRVDSPDAAKRSRPQWEIQVAAEVMERHFQHHMPATHTAFVKNGRVAP
jgi:thymidylate synthase (FAD)